MVRTCICGGRMEDKRPQAIYCSRACKTRASDARRIVDGRSVARDRLRYGAESEHRRDYARTYHRDRPEMVWEWRLRKRARRLGAAVYEVTFRDWRRLLARFRQSCAYCGRRTVLTCDHVTPLTRGGAHSVGNILPACSPCNTAKRTKLLVEWRAQSSL